MRSIKLPCKTYPTGSVGGGLPVGYQECDWLETDGSQWIDTGIIPDWNEDIEIQWCSYGGGWSMWGSDNYVYQIGYLRIFSTSAQGNYYHVAGKTFTGTYTASTGNFVISSDGITLSVVPRGDDACAVPMYLFRRYTGLSGERGRVMYAKIGTHHFVPALHINTQEGVMVDVSTGMVYHNKGTGAFTWQVKA